ncbi:MAG TPA: lipopolysaccharide assembly protein LapA domain-containing protein, partial [Chitinophagaceae bacterium]|nr:lipopolysaccharide assembly protein LapA domain-containing protein [Chitinophagaceae bacterium]
IIDIGPIILLFIFIEQNLEKVQVKFLFAGFNLPLVILILIVFFICFYTARSFVKKKEKAKSHSIPAVVASFWFMNETPFLMMR